jgi:hypothetical protein
VARLNTVPLESYASSVNPERNEHIYRYALLIQYIIIAIHLLEYGTWHKYKRWIDHLPSGTQIGLMPPSLPVLNGYFFLASFDFIYVACFPSLSFTPSIAKELGI